MSTLARQVRPSTLLLGVKQPVADLHADRRTIRNLAGRSRDHMAREHRMSSQPETPLLKQSPDGYRRESESGASASLAEAVVRSGGSQTSNNRRNRDNPRRGRQPHYGLPGGVRIRYMPRAGG